MKSIRYAKGKSGSGPGQGSKGGQGGNKGGGKPTPPVGSGGYPSTTGNKSGDGRFNVPSTK